MNSPSNLQRIRREIGNSAGLKHRNILPVYGYSLGFGPLVAIVTPWAENGSLAHYLEHNGETLSTRARFHIVIHGDLTSVSITHGRTNKFSDRKVQPNILIDRHGAARLADFGLSISLSASASWTTTLHGNLPWMAPELFRETHDRSPVWPTKQSDVYSLGCCDQTLTGRFPYHHLENMAIAHQKLNAIQPSREFYPTCLDRHWQLMERCWMTLPHERPSTDMAVNVIAYELDCMT
ncbi:kinase-like domain-containing protein [Suillus americanus]|nr:kinase-like domain-containing protein [Suillus americanus]